MLLFSSWQAEVCQRRTECSTPDMWEGWRGEERETPFLQACSKQSHTGETDSFHNKPSSEAFVAKSQKKAASVRKVWQFTSKPSCKTFVLISFYCRGHWLVEQLLRYVYTWYSTKQSGEQHEYVGYHGIFSLKRTRIIPETSHTGDL